jgi:hypothetical protein
MPKIVIITLTPDFWETQKNSTGPWGRVPVMKKISGIAEL